MTPLTSEQYDQLFASYNNDELFDAIAQQYTTLISKISQYKDNPSELPEIDRAMLSSLLKAGIKKTQCAPERITPSNYFSDIVQDGPNFVSESLGYEKKLLGAMKTLAPHTAKDKLGKKDFIRVCETARSLDSKSSAQVKKRIVSGLKTLLTQKSPIKTIPITYHDKRGRTTTIQEAYDSRFSDENEIYNDAYKRLKERNPLLDKVEPLKSKEQQKKTTRENSTYRLSAQQIIGGTTRIG